VRSTLWHLTYIKALRPLVSYSMIVTTRDERRCTMAVRNIVRIDEEKCDGCGNCVIACAEGAIEIRDGKAVIIKESYCDGLGACLGECRGRAHY